MESDEKKLMNQINDFFKKAGLEEEINKLAEATKNSFMIDGEATESLKEALKRSPDKLIDLIWNTVVGEEEADRAQKEAILYEEIPKNLKQHLPFITPEGLNLLVRTMNRQPFHIAETSQIYDFIPYGWVFNFVKDNQCCFAVMEELHPVLMSLKESDTLYEVGIVCLARCLINACLGLYGVFQQKQLESLAQIMLLDAGDTSENALDELMLSINENIPLFEEQGLLWTDRDYIISPHLGTKEVYTELLAQQGSKEHYLPDPDWIKKCTSRVPMDETKEYLSMRNCLSKEVRNQNVAAYMTKTIAGYVIRENYSLPQIMDALYDWGVAFDNPQSARRFTIALSKWLYNVRRWSECGYSRQERNLENIDAEYIYHSKNQKDSKTTAKKIYPNDPCPCGSGKKYKKCCGKVGKSRQ